MKTFRYRFLFALICFTGWNIQIIQAQNLKLHYGLSSDIQGSTVIIDESGNGYNGTLINGATITTFDEMPVVDLGTTNGYIDMGANTGNVIASLNDFSMVCKIYIPSSTSLSGNGNFVWSFSNSTNIITDANGCLFLSAKNTRYAISLTHYAGESGIETSAQLGTGTWKTIVYNQEQGYGTLYMNGILVAQGEIAHTPSELGVTPYNFIGRSSYSSDVYLKDAKIADFRIYDAALSAEQINDLSKVKEFKSNTQLLAAYHFDQPSDESGTYLGTLKNGAKLVSFSGNNMLDLGSEDGYFDFGAEFGEVIAQLDSFSISTNIYIPTTTNTAVAGNFIWTFANSDDMVTDANGNMFFTAINTRYAISKTNYQSESELNTGLAFPKGKWVNITYTQLEGNGSIYLNGTLLTQGSVAIHPKELGNTNYNFLGKSCYAADSYVKDAMYNGFMVYSGAMGSDEIHALADGKINRLNRVLDSMVLIDAMALLELENTNEIRTNIDLPLLIGGASISWTSNNPAVVSNAGEVTRPEAGEDPVSVTLTATLTYNSVSTQKVFELTIIPGYSDEESVAIDLSNIKIIGNIHNARSDLYLPIRTVEGSEIHWFSDSPEYLNNSGKVLKLSTVGNGKKSVTLTAEAEKGDAFASRDFEIQIAEEEDKTAYLFSYFTGNDTDGEQIRFAISYNGYDYTPLNNGQPIMSSDTISIKGGVRDPHILRGEDGNFYMVVTDMKSAEGWSSNRGIVLLKSPDLVHWTHSTVHFPTRFPEQWANVTRVWAPQTIYDPVVEKYMVYFSLLTNDGSVTYDKIFYSYANDDFTDLETAPVYFYDRGSATIDGDIVYNEVDSLYHMVYKNEGSGGICKVTAKTLTPEQGQVEGSQWSEPSDRLEQTNEAVEGAGVFRLINTDKWVLMYDVYGSGYYQYCQSNDLENFTWVKNNSTLHARHGTSIAITNEEAERLLQNFPPAAGSNFPLGASQTQIRQDGLTINNENNTIEIPVNYGTDISSFDPKLYATPGTAIQPVGKQDFSSNTIQYQFTSGTNTVNYDVKVFEAVNPVLPGFHADPEILYSEKTERFYIYPTTDGFTGWGGYYFDVFSSPDLVNWTNEGTILDLSTSQVSWATGNAWAPCIQEVKTGDDTYKYYFYFSGESGGKKIGVAVANDPAGPFVDHGEPIITDFPDGVSGGQQIDVDVFVDPVSGKPYIYWGNGYLAVAELNNDMVSVKDGTTVVLTPQGGTLSTYAYREAPYVFYRNGKYYFLWSVDDTGSPNYHVAYGTSDSPTGPITVAEEPIVIIQDAENEIYGTAHNAILQIPGKDEWYMVYHRINRHYLNNGPGYHREVCIDRMYFNEDGTIQNITPTKTGIEPVEVKKRREVAPNVNNHELDARESLINVHGAIIKREVYDLSGRYKGNGIDNIASGLYLVRNVYSDGYMDTTKLLITLQ